MHLSLMMSSESRLVKQKLKLVGECTESFVNCNVEAYEYNII